MVEIIKLPERFTLEYSADTRQGNDITIHLMSSRFYKLVVNIMPATTNTTIIKQLYLFNHLYMTNIDITNKTIHEEYHIPNYYYHNQTNEMVRIVSDNDVIVSYTAEIVVI
mgnify:CR=1 FL=1